MATLTAQQAGLTSLLERKIISQGQFDSAMAVLEPKIAAVTKAQRTARRRMLIRANDMALFHRVITPQQWLDVNRAIEAEYDQ